MGILGVSGVVAGMVVVVIGDLKRGRRGGPAKRRIKLLVISLVFAGAAAYGALTSLVESDSRSWAIQAAVCLTVQLVLFVCGSVPFWLDEPA